MHFVARIKSCDGANETLIMSCFKGIARATRHPRIASDVTEQFQSCRLDSLSLRGCRVLDELKVRRRGGAVICKNLFKSGVVFERKQRARIQIDHIFFVAGIDRAAELASLSAIEEIGSVARCGIERAAPTWPR